MSNKYYTLVILGLMIIVKYLFFSPKLSFDFKQHTIISDQYWLD